MILFKNSPPLSVVPVAENYFFECKIIPPVYYFGGGLGIYFSVKTRCGSDIYSSNFN
jgi:hypothetical protein